MNIHDLHQQSMEIMDFAIIALHKHDKEESRFHFEKAFLLEREAAIQAVKKNVSEPTRSILLRSAACLACDCERFHEAEQLAALGLAEDPPESIAQELREILLLAFEKQGFKTDLEEHQHEQELLHI